MPWSDETGMPHWKNSVNANFLLSHHASIAVHIATYTVANSQELVLYFQ